MQAHICMPEFKGITGSWLPAEAHGNFMVGVKFVVPSKDKAPQQIAQCVWFPAYVWVGMWVCLFSMGGGVLSLE